MRRLYYEGPKKHRLVFWNERLSHGQVVGHHTTVSREPNEVTANITMWILKVGEKTRHLIAVDIDKTIPGSTLVNTAFGLVCPRCKTNEFIHPQLDWQISSVREANRYDSGVFGYYCRCCNTLSEK